MTTYKYLSDSVVAKIYDDGISRMSCSVEHPDFLRWLAEGNTPLPADPPTQAELDAAAEREALRQLAIKTKATTMFDTLKTATLAQINTWVDNNFASLTAQQRALLKLLAAVAGMYLRERA